MAPVAFFLVTFPVCKTYAYLLIVLRAHYAICRYMFTDGFQYNFRQITASFSVGRRWKLVVRDMLLFWNSWFAYRFMKLDLVKIGKFCFHFTRGTKSAERNVTKRRHRKSNHVHFNFPCHNTHCFLTSVFFRASYSFC